MAVGVTPGELRELADDELKDRLRESKEELFNLRFQMATGQLTNNRRLRTVRQEIARVYTVLRERELGLASGPAGMPARTPPTSTTTPSCWPRLRACRPSSAGRATCACWPWHSPVTRARAVAWR